VVNKNILSVKAYVTKNKRGVFIALIFLIGAILLLLSSNTSQTQNFTDGETLSEYKARLEGELADMCSSVEGVGRCRVSVSFERGEEKEYKGSTLISSRPPKVLGVTVVCRGADSDRVRAEIIGMMSALFDIGTNRIAVLKLN
jgi:hypothetical protein